MEPRSFGLQKGAQGPALNAPNVITLGGYVATIAWLMGASKAWGVVGLIADEVDGRVARATKTATDYGSLLDWATDLTLTGAVAYKANLLWSLPPVTAIQAYLRQEGVAPAVGSARAVYTIIALLQKDQNK